MNYFDYVLNLFSSFGYFESERENYNAFRANAVACKPGGSIIVDFFNAKSLRRGNTVEQEIDGITFTSRKYFTEHHVRKEVRFSQAEMNGRLPSRCGFSIGTTFTVSRKRPACWSCRNTEIIS